MKKTLKKVSAGKTSKYRRAAKLATSEAKRENTALGLKVLVARKDGLYYKTSSGTEKLFKKGNYKPITATLQSIKLAK